MDSIHYVSVTVDTEVTAEVLDAAACEVVLRPRFGGECVLTFPSPEAGQQFVIDLSDKLHQAQKRGPAVWSQDPLKLEAF